MELTLMNRRVLMSMQELNRIFNCNDMVELALVNEIDNCRQSRTFSAPGRAGYKYEPVFYVNDFLQLVGQIKVIKVGRVRGYYAHHNGVCAPLFENINAEPRLTRSTKRKIGRPRLFYTFVS